MTTTWAAVLTVGAVVALCNMQYSSANVVVPSKRIERVCGSIDVRNQVEHFSILENCTVIEGHLRIRLIEFSPEEDFNTLSFPDLREITDYVLLYRVYGLRSLAHMFPNLSVIRGQHLFFDYALVVFEMPDLEELGLQGMTRILRGAVRIEKNPQLCYIDTVDWSVLGVHKDDNFILQNKAVNECFNMCPKNEDGSDKCHLRTIAVDSDDDYTQASCWNADSCQKVCPLECGKQPCYKKQPNSSFECCHQECVGGCAGPKKSDCFACTNVFSDGSCESGCPRGTYKFRDRRCLTEAQCRELNFSKRNEVQQKWKLLDGQCALECPSGYMENASDPHRCEQCRGRCPKVCNSLTIDSVAAAQQAKGCTYVNGAIEIQIRGGNQISSELEENLGMIEVVQDYVKIVRSHALLSFHFLKNLRLIKGQRLYDIKYALYILDNQNLQDTWDLNKHNNLTIENGIMFFHFNRKLCLHKIHDLASLVKIREKITDSDVSPTNGDLVPCLISTVALDVFNVESTFALVRWSSFNTSDEREVLSWVIYYRETNDENVTIFDSRDACGSNDMWKTIDHKPDVDKSDRYTADILYHLKPFTKYALYVQTYTIMTAQRGARSAIQYFMTLPDTPSPARDVAVESKYPGELHVSWKPPANPNGNVTHYYVYWQPQPMPAHKFRQRDYCKDKLRLVTKPKASEEVDIIASNKTSVDGQCCSCPKSITQIQSEDEERRFQIEFENFLHDSVYRKHSRKTDDSDSAAGVGSLLRKRRSVMRYIRKNRSNSLHQERVSSNSGKVEKKRVKRFSDEDDELDMSRLGDRASKYSQLFNNVTFTNNMTLIPPLPSVDESELEPYEAAIVYDKTEIILTNLKHFQEYSIEVIACHEFREERHNDRKLCSNRAITTARTLPNRSADLIDPKNVSIDVDYGKDSGRSPQVRIKWTDPPNPNGLVVLYDIEFSRVDVAFYKPETYCIPHSLFAANGGYIAEKLAPGNWSFRIRVTSLAGNGSWTDHQYFIVDQMDTSATHFAVIISVVLVVVVLVGTAVVLGIFFFRKKQEEKMLPDKLYVLSANPHYADPENTYIADEWEVPRDKVKKIRELGKGSFGMVYEGLAEDLMEDQPKTKVAIKTVGEKASSRDMVLFLNEASVMKQFKAHHVVQLLGIVSKGRPPLVIMELMANGDLKNYLRMLRPDEEKSCSREPLTLRRTLQMAGEIADGMAYLAYKKFVHRDLAARNCMVSDDLTVKIGDFGMTRDIYEKEYYRNGARGLLPVRWMAPEALKDGTFSIETDVWSYGVVLWEMATLAAMPYQGLSNEEVLKFVTDGGRMQRPEDCPDRIFDIMDRCWQLRPSRRPSFIGILEELMEDLSETFREVSFYHSQDRFAGTVLDTETEDAVERAGESVADDERTVGNTTSLLYGSQPEKEPLCPMDNSRLMPIMPVDKLTYCPGEGSAVADRFADCGVSETYSGVSERLLGGQGDAEVHQSLANSHEPYTDAPKSVARSNRLTNGHIPYQNAQPSDGVLVRVGITNC